MNMNYELSDTDPATRFMATTVKAIMASGPARVATGTFKILVQSATVLIEPRLLKIQARCDALQSERTAYEKFITMRNTFAGSASLAKCRHYCEIVLRIPDHGARLNAIISTVAQYDVDHKAAETFMEMIFDSVQQQQNFLMKELNRSADAQAALPGPKANKRPGE
jgi:hypothetical protein